MVLYKKESQSESKTECAVVRLAGIEKREWISILILEVLLYASALESVHVQCICLCVISKDGRMRGSPLWHWPPLSFMFHHSSYDMIINTQTHKTAQRHTHLQYNKEPGYCFICMSAWFSKKPGWVAWHRHSIPGCPEAALGQEAHHHSSHCTPRWMAGAQEKGVEERQ